MHRNPHALSEDTQSILDVLVDYHRTRLLDFEARREREQSADARRGTFSLARAIDRMATATVGGDARTGYVVRGNQLDGAEREYFQEVARAAGQPFDSLRPIIPWAYFCGSRSVATIGRDIVLGANLYRDLTAASAAGGGYLVSSATRDAVDALRPFSVVTRMGVTVEAGLTDNLIYPRTTGHVTGYWLGTEASALTESQPTLGQFAMTPKHAGALVEFSRLFAKQTNAERFVARELLRTVGTLVDVAVLNGSGAAGQPTGLLNTSGLGTQSGTSLNIAGIAALKGDVASANAPDDAVAYLTTPDVRELLEARIATGSGDFLWASDRVGSRPGFVSTVVPAATMICGAWPEVVWGSWGPGFEFSINPNDPAGFKAGVVQARVLVACDVAVAHAAAFSVAGSVT